MELLKKTDQFNDLNETNRFTSADKFFSKMIVLMLIINPGLYFVNLLNIQYLDVFLSSLLILFLCLFNKKYFKGLLLKVDIIIIFFFFVLTSTFSGFFYQDYLVNWFGIIYFLLLSSFPWYIIGRFTTNYNTVLYYMQKYSFAITLIGLSIYFHKIIQGTLRHGEMGLSYGILPATIISLYVFFTQKKQLHLINVIVTLFLILGIGSRGPILCILVFLILFLIINVKRNFVLAASIATFAVVIYLNLEQILVSTIQMFKKYNITSRTLHKLYEGTITSGTGREDIRKLSLELIKENPFTGIGIGIDRIEIYSKIYADTGRVGMLSSSYPHNLFIEILLQFGVIIGAILIGLVLLFLILSILRGNKKEKDIVIIFIAIGFVELLVSSSYILSPYFFYLLGITFSITSKRLKGINYN